MFSPVLAYSAYIMAAVVIKVGLIVAVYERTREGVVSCVSIGIIAIGIAFLFFLLAAIPLA